MNDSNLFPAAVAILAGGESRRMGTDKASLRTESGVTLLERTARLAQEALGLPVLVVGREQPEGWSVAGVRFLPDEIPGQGPLGGLQAALQMGSSVLALSCDLPLLSAEALQWLTAEAANLTVEGEWDGIAARNGERIEPLFAVYDASCLPRIAEGLRSGRRSLTRLIESAHFAIANVPPVIAPALANVNTPEDWAAVYAANISDRGDDGSAPTASRVVWRLRDGQWRDRDDCLVVEEPLEIRVDDRRFTVTMRTPGDDLDLARGLLFAEGVIASHADLGDLRYCDADGEDAPNLIVARLHASAPRQDDPRRWQRNLISGTSCGLCGKAAIEAVACTGASLLPPAEDGSDAFDARILLSLSDRLREKQVLFTRTGGLHAAGLFDATGECRAAAEDIGRHNATDKVIGRGLREGWLPWDPTKGSLALLVSGRASFEIVQKALMARIPIVCSVSAASALAAELAEANHQTLIGFLRGSGMTVYAGRERITTSHPSV